MQNETIVCDFNKGCNVFEYLPAEITTLETIMEYIEIVETDKYGDTEPDCDFSLRSVQAVKNLRLDWNECHDDFFNTKINKVMTNQDILEQYNIKIIPLKEKHNLQLFCINVLHRFKNLHILKCAKQFTIRKRFYLSKLLFG